MSSAFRQVQKQARQLLVNLRKEIRTKEGDLRRLREEEQRLSRLTGQPEAREVASGGRGGRINWRAVLSDLPKQFKASDIRDTRGLKDKRPSEIFAAVTRWIDAGLVKRRSRGVYERTS
ncbi:MAG TPA: hypothetical protein VMB26_00490 [Candidatus Binataceae bacterium]|nr:hypothetical protein [Candidatus Binataceae bacterium]